MGAARRLALTAWRADDGRMRAAAWTASAAALLGTGLVWSALRVIGLYALWTVGMNEGLLFAAEFGTRAALLAATVLCVVLGVARRAARDAGRGWLIAAILLAGLLLVAQVVQLTSFVRFDVRTLFSSTSLSWLGFADLTIAACVLALTARRPTVLRGADASATGSARAAGQASAQASAQAAGPYLWFSVAAAFVAFVACILVVAQALIVPNAWGPALVALAQAVVTVLVVTVQLVATLFAQRGSALARLVASAVAVVLLSDAAGSSLLGIAGDDGVSQLGLLVATACAVAAAVPLWLPPVCRFLADAADERVDADAVGRTRAAV